jgi:topoisomerase-4 subunit A
MPKVKISFNKRLKETKDLEDKIVSLNEIIDVKGDKAQGNQLTKLKVKDVTLVDIIPGEEWPEEIIPSETLELKDDSENVESNTDENNSTNNVDAPNTKILEEKENINLDTNSETSIELEWDVKDEDNKESDEDGQMKIF